MPIDWNAVTGVGTVAVALSAVGVAVLSDRLSGARLRNEREYSERQLADERAQTDSKINEERRIAQEREQFAEASLVEVVLTVPRAGAFDFAANSGQVPKLKLTVRNHGHYAITQICAWALISAPRSNKALEFRQPRQEQRFDAFNPDSKYIEPVPGAHPDWLPPWDARLIFEKELPDEKEDLAGYPVVRWTDRWGTAWEHKRGRLRQVESSAAMEFSDVDLSLDKSGA